MTWLLIELTSQLKLICQHHQPSPLFISSVMVNIKFPYQPINTNMQEIVQRQRKCKTGFCGSFTIAPLSRAISSGTNKDCQIFYIYLERGLATLDFNSTVKDRDKWKTRVKCLAGRPEDFFC